MQQWRGFKGRDKETGRYGYWRNPKAKWDWYVEGGRWANQLLLKTGELVNTAYLKDLDFPGMKAKRMAEGLKYWEEAQTKPKEDRAFLYDITPEMTKEEYLKPYQKPFSCFAVLMNGEWHKKGEMGWFGISHNDVGEDVWSEKVAGLLASLSPDTRITIVDCHI